MVSGGDRRRPAYRSVLVPSMACVCRQPIPADAGPPKQGDRPIRVLTATVATLIVTTGTAAGTMNSTTQLDHSKDVVRFFQNHSWLRAPRQPNCTTIPWTRSCTIARRVYAKHYTIVRQDTLEHTIPWTNDWRTAVRLTQRVFPGTESWLLYISHREGGYGPFVMNHQGSGAGGWMQFMASTFYAYDDDARQAVQARGFKVDPSVWSWTHPLGQALTAGYMRYTGRDGCHWCL